MPKPQTTKKRRRACRLRLERGQLLKGPTCKALLDDADAFDTIHASITDALDTITVRGDAAEEPIRRVLQTLVDDPEQLGAVLDKLLYGETG